ncbi:hypothetical protein QBC36DRAFT_92335 [Triangularia setosa]|uniref:Uncharacterized protein n=1 Tax=Triangularia setosa TaxID=2587417 RepID=A0AAN6VYG8_9PEZI|nr:hypothetical protein QBC36DRAFT_92335 [Podospora setosa]
MCLAEHSDWPKGYQHLLHPRTSDFEAGPPPWQERCADSEAIEQLANGEREAWVADGPVEVLPPVIVPVIKARLQRTAADERRRPNRQHRRWQNNINNPPSENDEPPMADHRPSFVSWKRVRSMTTSHSTSDNSSVALTGTPSSSPSSPIPLPAVLSAPPVTAPPPPPPSAVTPLTTHPRAKRALVQLPAKLGCSLTKVIMLNKMASWVAKTRHWKKAKRDYVKEVPGERNLFVGAV